MTFRVMVDDNYHYMDETERYQHGEFATLDAAIAAARKIVDEYLQSAYTPGMSADALIASYCQFGEDPFISGPEVKGVVFSARDYARVRCPEICGK
jgi:hypothetical protein